MIILIYSKRDRYNTSNFEIALDTLTSPLLVSFHLKHNTRLITFI